MLHVTCNLLQVHQQSCLHMAHCTGTRMPCVCAGCLALAVRAEACLIAQPPGSAQLSSAQTSLTREPTRPGAYSSHSWGTLSGHLATMCQHGINNRNFAAGRLHTSYQGACLPVTCCESLLHRHTRCATFCELPICPTVSGLFAQHVRAASAGVAAYRRPVVHTCHNRLGACACSLRHDTHHPCAVASSGRKGYAARSSVLATSLLSSLA